MTLPAKKEEDKVNLLIVDDEYFIVQSIVSALDFDALGITSVSTAFSVKQAQAVFAEKRIDILLTDIEMPRQSGLDLIEWTYQEGYKPIALILTGHPLFDYAHRALKAALLRLYSEARDRRNPHGGAEKRGGGRAAQPGRNGNPAGPVRLPVQREKVHCRQHG